MDMTPESDELTVFERRPNPVTYEVSDWVIEMHALIRVSIRT